jgi:hypothetical protein
MIYRKFWSVLFSLFISSSIFSTEARSSSSVEELMFRVALEDPTMQYLVKENFSNSNITVACAVLSKQWQLGRVSGSNPSNPGDPMIPFLMHGMAEVTLFAVQSFQLDEVKDLTKRALAKFEYSEKFRSSSMSVCSTLMVPIIRFVMQKNNIVK